MARSINPHYNWMAKCKNKKLRGIFQLLHYQNAVSFYMLTNILRANVIITSSLFLYGKCRLISLLKSFTILLGLTSFYFCQIYQREAKSVRFLAFVSRFRQKSWLWFKFSVQISIFLDVCFRCWLYLMNSTHTKSIHRVVLCFTSGVSY